MRNYTIRQAREADAALILDFIIELAKYEKAENEVEATEQDIVNTLFGAQATSHCLICENNDKPVGFAVYFYNYSTWQGQNGLYLEDLFVSPDERGKGAGTALLKYLANLALEKSCGRFEWSVLDWNKPAIDFYDSIGAQPKNEWLGYRLSGDALTAFANS
ncbi:GNAT family N-acetyltransferase [Salinimonas chungwhensis]|uniref:GNAT family N-acetyltransferase n=1 Tax=Salinimonas chungwhensis TaxID=265425 RepID=UPI000365A3AA|nr:GNAT family N-acetyltransferase [Salinimonas chungwhensis]